MVVLDTSALLYWTLDPAQLTSTARQVIEEADHLVISSISVWEIGLKVKRGKLTIPLSITDYVDRLFQLDKLEIRPVGVRTWLANLDLVWEHRDPADRTVVATARLLSCPLVASDRRIAEFYEETVW
ncbi:MAG TPA: type II toxin-antitoxin system VapC family toxin [Anaerolineae bacterium]|jgi:PIN domain nuclease of toxin-antitoxin system|nr:type II toxin-antitoxin system VapC family toxin [Anaerolineae bacterium]